MRGGIIAFQAAAGGISDENLVNMVHLLIFGYLCAHTAHFAIFGTDAVEIGVSANCRAGFGTLAS